MLSDLELTEENHKALKRHCEKLDIEFMSTAFGKRELDILINCDIKSIKVASGEITNKPLLEYMAMKAAKHELDILLSTENTIKRYRVHRIFLKEKISRKVTIMHCTSSYPAPKNELNINVKAN